MLGTINNVRSVLETIPPINVIASGLKKFPPFNNSGIKPNMVEACQHNWSKS